MDDFISFIFESFVIMTLVVFQSVIVDRVEHANIRERRQPHGYTARRWRDDFSLRLLERVRVGASISE